MDINNTNQQGNASFFEKNKHFLILLVMLVVVIGLSVTILLAQFS